jgi:hypothetical protein
VDTKTIYIEIVGKAKFEVLYHRVTSNTVGADVGGVGFLFPVGGVIGAGIQSGIEASKDEDKTKQLKPLIEKEGWKTQFLDTLNDKLEVEGFTAVWVEDTRDIEDGIVLRIYPKNFGFKRVDTSTQLVSAFIDFKASFWRGNLKSSKKQEKEAYYFTNRNRYPFNKLLEEDSPLNSDLEEVLEKAAKRLANKIIYGLKE